MNIFVLDQNPRIAAQYHCNKHMKMCVETAQMLSSAVIRHGATPEQMPTTMSGAPYRKSHPNHPCTKWAGDTCSNFLWLCDLGNALCEEYTMRYKKNHFCQSKIQHLRNMSKMIPDGPLTEFAVAISDDSLCRTIPNFDTLSVVDKYRAFYNYDKASFATWSVTNPPSWFQPQSLVKNQKTLTIH